MTTSTAATKASSGSFTLTPLSVSACLLLGIVFLLSYAQTLRLLIADWSDDPAYSFGLVAPFVVAYLIFTRRESLRAEPIAPRSGLGLGLVISSQLVFVAGSMSAEFFLQRSSIVVLIAGMIVYLAGWGWLKKLLLPLLLLQLCIPLPAVVLQEVSIPLQLVSSSGAAALLKLFGIPVFRSGNILQLPQQVLSVTEACSGLRSLASMVALALVLVNSSRLWWWLRVLFISSAVVVAVVSNSLRITGTGLLGEYFGRHATLGIWHSIEGWFVFVVAFLMLLGELTVLQRFFGEPGVKGEAA